MNMNKKENIDKKENIEEGVIKLIVQGAMGQVVSLILPTKDIEYVSEILEKIKDSYGYVDFKTLGSEILRGKILI